jgi:large subunit ribosomal protein L18
MAFSKIERRKKIKRRIRKKIAGTDSKPRLTVYRSNKEIYVQLIDDLDGKTVLSVSSKMKEVSENKSANKTEQAVAVGTLAAEKCKEAGIAEVVFDRNGYLYHGRVKALADAARKGGLKF